jgi:tRNA modification GTPase
MRKSFSTDDTIAAIASAPGGAARGILRISGPATEQCLKSALQFDQLDWSPSRIQPRAYPARLPLLGSHVECSVYYWPTVRSYTGQPSAELHLLGTPPLLQAALNYVCAHDARLAEPGEFTLRAFLAGRIDLAQAEAVLGVIDANTDRQFRESLEQLAGGMSTPLTSLRSQLLDLLADLEAGLDFVEEDIEFISREQLLERLENGRDELDHVLQKLRDRRHDAPEYRIVLVGAPNVGKSSLWNMLLNNNEAIVSDTAGTTRDYLTAKLAFGGWICQVVDTAGLSEMLCDSVPDRIAQQATTHQAEECDARVLCLDSTRRLNDEERVALQRWSDERTLVVLTKSDLSRECDYEGSMVATSAHMHMGKDELLRAIELVLERQVSSSASMLSATTARCETNLVTARDAIDGAIRLTSTESGEELVAAELRRGLDEIGCVIGTVYTDDLLDRIFSRFCIGK